MSPSPSPTWKDQPGYSHDCKDCKTTDNMGKGSMDSVVAQTAHALLLYGSCYLPNWVYSVAS